MDEGYLNEIYEELKASGMKAGMFSINAKWEGSYGNLEHSAERLPHFEQFLDRVRADGYKIGVWAALMRCERPGRTWPRPRSTCSRSRTDRRLL